MKRLVIGIAVALILGAVAGVVVHTRAAAGTIYSVSQLDAILRRHPAAVLGTVIQVRGVVGFCPVRAGCPANVPPVFSDHLGTLSPDPPLQIEYGSRDSLMATLRGLPVLGALMPRPTHLIDGYQGVLRMRIEAAPPYACYQTLCYEGILQGMTPP